MKTSKLLITSLLAAATLSVPAYADDVSGDVAVSAGNSTAYVMTDDTTFTFTNNPTLTGSISGAYTLTTSGNATLATGFGGTDDTRWTDGNLVVSAGTLQWGQGNTGAASANQTKALGKTISVSSGAALKIHLWTGKDLDTSTDGKVNITSKIILNGTSTLETADGSYYFSGGIQVGDGSTEGTATFRANWDKAIVISSLSGSGTMNFVGANTTWGAPLFSLGGNGGFSGTLNVTSTSLHLTSENAASGATLNIAGGASLYLDATTNNVKGLSGSGSVVAATAGNTLAIATETGVTNTFSGTVGTSTSAVGLSVSGSGTQTLAGTSYLGDVSVTGGSLSLGGTVSLANTVSVSGSASVSVNDSVIFILNDSYKADDTWTLISGGSSVSGWSNLTLNNFRKADGSLFSGRSGISVGTSGVVSITEGTSASLIWNGTSGNSTWNTSTTNKNWTNDNLPSEDKADSFYTLDNVTFKSLENVVTTVTLENGADIKVGDMTVESGDYTLNAGAGNSATISGSTLSVAKGASL
ncbi:MAG: beta strand repeat-containing protein, partial [Candidatus Spyradosoma sp.]